MTPLRQRLMEDLRCHRSPGTIETYVRHVKAFAEHFVPLAGTVGSRRDSHLSASPAAAAGQSETPSINAFPRHGSMARPSAAGTLERLPYGRIPNASPGVLGREEVPGSCSRLPQRPHRVLLTTIYATGLRVSEAVALSVADIDSRELTILVARGKGNKQRLVPLSPKLLEELRAWWRTHRHPRWLFPSKRSDRPLTANSVPKGLPAGGGLRVEAASPPTRCVTPMPRSCWKRASTCSRSRRFWATVAAHHAAVHACAAGPSAGGGRAANQALSLLPLEQLRSHAR